MLRSNVEAWRTSALTDLATALAQANNQTFQVNIDQPKNYFASLGTSWKGAAYTAAYDRVGQDHDQARKVWTYVDDLVTAIKQVAGDIESHRTTLMNKVSDARAHGLTVADNWVIPDKDGVPVATINSLQDAINQAFYPFRDAVSTAATKISEAAELIRAAGDLYGSDIDVTAAPAAGSRLGAEDGQAAADAARNGDTAKLDEIASHLPTNALTPQQMQDLANGKDVPSLPADVQDYYKSFFQHSGKDGLLALQNQLQQEATATSDHPASTVAAAQQRALADGMMAVSNEHLGTGTGPDGKLISPGAYTNLPPDIRQLISGREQEYVGDKSGPGDTFRRMQDRVGLANLLGSADPEMTGGTTFSTEVGRQAQSIAQYVDSSDGRPMAFTDDETKSLDGAATKLLDTATKNHDASYQLLTGHGLDGSSIPNDLSFGADKGQYLSKGDYDPQKFADTVFRNHTWTDQGKAASDLYNWTSDHAHDQSNEGVVARKTMDALPGLFAPHDGDKLITDKDGKTLYEHTIENFNKNPELANALGRVNSSNIDAFAQVDNDHNAPKPASPMEVRDAQRMLFLSSQTEDGRQTVDLARQTYDNATLYSVTHGGTGDDVSAHDAVRKVAAIDALVGDSERNALIYQDHNDVAQKNDQAQHSHDDKQQIGDTVKKVVDAVPIPGGKAVSTVKDIVEDQAYKDLMKGINPDPIPGTVQYPSVIQLEKDSHQDFRDQLNSLSGGSNDPLVKDQLEKYRDAYNQQYDSIVQSDQVHDNSSLDQLVTGGAQAPDATKKGS
ncbi:hypothetical protein [Nocardia sp. GAS34]|uniref:TPR repeat region-containing protein n=1 Tax=unclassified Nocardia TaxID=2637762 RepID=UPI003D1FF61E